MKLRVWDTLVKYSICIDESDDGENVSVSSSPQNLYCMKEKKSDKI